MALYTEATRRYEQQLLAKADTSAYLPEVRRFLKVYAMKGDYLIPHSSNGIPWLFENITGQLVFRVPHTTQKMLRICGFLFSRRQSWRT